jgi:phosphoglucomutase
MLMLFLEDGRRVVVRPSGTEPKIKFYLSGKREGLNEQTLPAAKAELAAALNRLWADLQADAGTRAA